MERNMNKALLILASAAIVSLSLTAGHTSEMPRPPRVSFVATSASQLQLGMTADDVIHVGKVAKDTNSRNGSAEIRKLEFADPIPGQVVLSDGKVSRVTLDPFRTDKAALPSGIRRAWPGFASSAVQLALGRPSVICHYAFFGIEVDQWIYAHLGEGEASVFFRDNRVIARVPGRDVPDDLFEVHLPLPPQPDGKAPASAPRVGMTAHDVRELYGSARFRVDYVRNGQPASREVYETKGFFVAFTFVDDVLTEMETLGPISDVSFLQGF